MTGARLLSPGSTWYLRWLKHLSALTCVTTAAFVVSMDLGHVTKAREQRLFKNSTNNSREMTSSAFTPEQKWDTCMFRYMCREVDVTWELVGFSSPACKAGVGCGGEPEADRVVQGQGS